MNSLQLECSVLGLGIQLVWLCSAGVCVVFVCVMWQTLPPYIFKAVKNGKRSGIQMVALDFGCVLFYIPHPICDL